MKNKSTDLANHLFAQLERLGDEKLKGEELQAEIDRAKAVRSVADGLIQLAKANTDRLKLVHETGVNIDGDLLHPKLAGPGQA